MEENNSSKSKYNLQERLIEFAILIIGLCERLDGSRISQYIAGQLIRSGTAPALLYGEALGAESRRDFVHKLKLLLKELRESSVSLAILTRTRKLAADHEATRECGELIAITSKSIQTATKSVHGISKS